MNVLRASPCACIVTIIFALLIFMPFQNVSAGDIEWSGVYRAEGTVINNAILDRAEGKTKEYGMHNLILRPRIVAADGLYIDAQFGLYENPLGNQMGSYIGDGPGNGTGADINSANAAAETEDDADIRISHFYLTWVQEHGAMIVGRAPLHFGLGVTHNSGRGLFDHFADIRDIVGYKVSMGNFYFLPMYGKLHESDISGADDVHEINFQMQYDNADSETELGLFYSNRKSDAAGNDMPIAAYGGDITKAPGEVNTKNFNIFYRRNFGNAKFGIEVAQQGGDTGVINSDGEGIKLSGFGVAAEFDYTPEGKKAYGLKMGYATGDDPGTTSDYEGFLFDRNYDVAILLFNHGLGRADVLKSALYGRQGDAATDVGSTVNDEADVEAVGNAYYFSPYMRYKWSDKWSGTMQVTAAWLDSADIDVAGTLYKAEKDLGIEVDLSFDYKFSEKIVWRNQFAFLTPGAAWEVDDNFDAESAYGFVSKAAVSF